MEKELRKLCKSYNVEYSVEISEYIKENLKNNSNIEVLLVCFFNNVKLETVK